jgi:hypothetical protein
MPVVAPLSLHALHWGRAGDRRALLVHGVQSSANSWWRIADALAHADVHVTAPDLRGHGHSPSGARYALEDMSADLLALGRAYRTSALADPHLYAVMFGSPVPGFEPAPEDYAHAEATFTPLLDTVRRAVAAGLLRDADPSLIATALWANVHGLVSLELGCAMPSQAGAPPEVFEAAIRANLDGWRRGATRS